MNLWTLVLLSTMAQQSPDLRRQQAQQRTENLLQRMQQNAAARRYQIQLKQQQQQQERFQRQQDAQQRQAAAVVEQQRAKEAAIEKKRLVAIEWSNAQTDPAIAVAEKAHLNTKFFGIQLGMPMRNMPECAVGDKPGKICVVNPLNTSKTIEGAMADLYTAITLPEKHESNGLPLFAMGHQQLKWVRMVYSQVQQSVLTNLAVATEANGEALSYLKARYGDPTSDNGDVKEWKLPGLQIKLSQPLMKKAPKPPKPSQRYECASYPCTAWDAEKANMIEALPGALANFEQTKAYVLPNLMIKTDTFYKGPEGRKTYPIQVTRSPGYDPATDHLSDSKAKKAR